MKKVVLLILLFLAPHIVCAQEKFQRHELFINAGGLFPILATPDVYSLSDTYDSNIQYRTEGSKKAVNFGIGYMYHLSHQVAIGLSYNRAYVNGGDLYAGSSLSLGTIKQQLNVIMFTVKYQWTQNKHFNFYSRVGIGSCNITESKIEDAYPGSQLDGYEFSDTKKELAWQVIPIGVDWQILSHWSLFAEGGVGVLGCLQGGIKMTF